MKRGPGLPWVAWIAVVLCVYAAVWIGASSDELSDSYSFRGKKGDYYSLLVSGFMRGHLYMDIKADPRLASADPEVHAHTPTLLDAGYFQGHFYLYYGVVPAVALLLPYRAVTGQDLGINTACVYFWLVGFGASIFWLRSWWSDRGGGGALLAALSVVVLALFPATSFLIRRSMFYELPLVAGYAYLSLFLAALYEVFSGRKVGPWLVVASASLGLAVGCHPNHVFLLPVLVFAAVRAVCDRRAAGGRMAGLAMAAAVPVTAIGAALAWYNFARFGSPFEFGFKYGQNAFFAVKRSLYVPSFLWTNIKWYLLTPPALTPYFPFVFPGNNTFRPPGYEGAEAMHGELIMTIAVVWTCAALAVAMRRLRGVPRLGSFALSLGYAAAAAIIFVCILQIRADRYMADFSTPLSWLLVIGAFFAWQAAGTRLIGRIWRSGYAAVVAAGAAYFMLAAVQQFEQFLYTRPATFNAFSRALNIPYSWIYRMQGTQPGLLVLNLGFSRPKQGVIEPLVTTGTPGYSDSVYATQYPNDLVQFSFNHKGYGGPTSELIAFDYGRPHVVEVSMGSFYPPQFDPFLAELGSQTGIPLKKLAYLKVDGRVLVSSIMVAYESPPWDRQIGANDTTLTEFKRSFSGTVNSVATVPIRPLLEELNRATESGIYHFKVQFPAREPLSGLPLMGIGPSGDGNLILAKAEGGAEYELDVDDWGYGMLKGRRFVAPAGEHDLKIVLGPILARTGLSETWQSPIPRAAFRGRVIVSLDGEIVGDFQLKHHLGQFREIAPGANVEGFSTADASFGNAFVPFPLTDADVHALLEKAAQAAGH